jgi:hypothetical protein
MSWELELELPEDLSYATLLPSTLRDIWDDPPRPPESVHIRPIYPDRPSPARSPHIGSAPSHASTPFRSVHPSSRFYSVQFHPLRTCVCASATEFDYGDWVIVEADRGIDLGQIISLARAPSPRDLPATRSIMRRAAPREADTVPAKQERERAAAAFCQAQARDARLPMEITGAEYQVDGKKLTFYYTALKYVDFRDLVRTLFRTFGTRIWMVWCDGGEPVRDVLTRKASDE